MLDKIGKTIAALGFIAAVGASVPANAAVYWVVFAGKAVPVDCPSSPDGQSLTWVNQNCTQLRVATAPDSRTATFSANSAGTFARSSAR